MKKTIVTNAVMKLMDDYILYITADALGQVFWFLEQVLKSKFNGGDTNGFVTQTIICVMRHIDVNRVTRYSLNLSQSVQKFIFNHLYALCFILHFLRFLLSPPSTLSSNLLFFRI